MALMTQWSFNLRKAASAVLMTAMVFSVFLGGCTEKKEKPAVDKEKEFVESFVEGEPDIKVDFPEEAFAKAKVLRNEKKPQMAEKLLEKHLEEAREAARGTTSLGKYLVRLNNCLFDQAKDDEAIKYGEIALKIFYNQPLEKRPLAPWFVNIHSYLGLSYQRRFKYEKAESHFRKAIQVAAAAPKAEVSQSWMRMLYQSLADCYDKEGKEKNREIVLKQLDNLGKMQSAPKTE